MPVGNFLKSPLVGLAQCIIYALVKPTSDMHTIADVYIRTRSINTQTNILCEYFREQLGFFLELSTYIMHLLNFKPLKITILLY